MNFVSDSAKAEEIYELQQMLRRIAQTEHFKPILNPDGIYGKETADAVREFQRRAALPVTGEVDFTTWNRIVSDYDKAERALAPGDAILPFPAADYRTHRGEKSDIILIIQIMLSAISIAYDDFEAVPLSGEYGTETADAVGRFQKINRLPETGDVDKATWNELARSYNDFSENPLYTN